MATNIETMWVGDPEQLQRTVQNLVSRGGVVQAQSETEVTLHIKKKMNVVVLVVGLVLCLVPGLAYLVWYLTADQNQQMTVKIGSPDTIRTDHQHWYDTDGTPPATDTAGSPPAASTSSAPPVPPEPAGLGTADPLGAIPTMPTPLPDPVSALPPPPPAPPAPPGGTSF